MPYVRLNLSGGCRHGGGELKITITIEGEEVTVKVTGAPAPAEGQTTLADFITTDEDLDEDGNLPMKPQHYPSHPNQGGSGDDEPSRHIPVRPNVDAEQGVNVDNQRGRAGNQGYARRGVPNSCSRCGQVNRRCREINEGFRCLTCEGWYDGATELHLHRRETGWFQHPLWAQQYERLQHGA